jgi:hypothetical protein
LSLAAGTRVCAPLAALRAPRRGCAAARGKLLISAFILIE